MSQVSIIDIEGNNPQIPTQFNANVGFAIPIGNVLEILGESVIAGSVPVQTVGSGNTITTQVQISQAIAASNASNVGLAAFNSADFTVDANGFVSAISGAQGIESVNTNIGGPVTPTGSGAINIYAESVAAVGIPIQTDGSIPNTVRVQLQRTSEHALSSSVNAGIASFSNAQFDVDGNGFVQLIGSVGAAITSITGNSGGAQVPGSPTAGNFNILGTGSITSVGTASTETIQLTGLTNHSVLVGAGTATITKVAPSATTGVPLISQGSSADPVFGTALVVGGGTGLTTVAQGDILYSSAANTLSALAKNTTATRYLSNTGTSNNPAWAQVNVANGVTGVLPVANGGTNASSLATTNGITKFDGTRIVTSSTALLSSGNIYTNTSQPIFSAYVNNAIANATGDGTTYTVIFDTKPVDQGSNFNLGTGVFTAPATGNYLFTTNITVNNIGVTNTYGYLTINSSNGSYFGGVINFTAAQAASVNQLSVTTSVIIPLATNNTCSVQITITNGTKTIGIQGAASSYFSGYLIG